MLKKYRVRWLVILFLIIVATATVSHLDHIWHTDIRMVLDYLLRIVFSVTTCWFVIGYCLVNETPFRNTTLRATAAIVASAILGYLISFCASLITPDNPLIKYRDYVFESGNIIDHLLEALLLSVVSYLTFYTVYTNDNIQAIKLENEVLEQEHLRAQLFSLQEQISPHFLFNSLSTLKTLSADQATKDYIVQLANVYRYVLNFKDKHLTELKDELGFTRSYLYIMRERFEEGLRIELDIPESHYRYLIPTLSLQIVIENAIKHNTVSPDRPLHIRIFANETPALVVRNNYQPKNNLVAGTGTGLKNIAERYKILLNKPVNFGHDKEFYTAILPLRYA
ncbi:MAG: histidine kinase [Mucilaginibacter polytrichastri]|nr:histidine kinase [Mucilaginibacter polytrichastri]